ncbi:MAG: HpcH/HpaI aldolase family protein [Verrucomicrobiales bacterium]
MPLNPLRKKLKSNQGTLGLWATMECASITEIAIALKIDWVVVDMEHGHLDYKDAMAHIRVVRETGTSIIIRVSDIREDCVKRALDMGAHGVILPVARSAADVERGYRFGRYAPRGARGVGGERAVKWGLGFNDYLQIANEETMIIPLIETREAAEDIDNILAVDGLEAIFLGPADMSASYGHLGEWEGGGVAQLNLDIRDKAAAKGIATGVVSTSVDDAKKRQEQGFQMIALGSDAGLLIRSLQQGLTALGRDAKPHLWF